MQGHCTCMVKKPFTTRIDDKVLELAQQLADVERRSVTSLIEVAILEYSERHPLPALRGPGG
jgi:predicted transcriptional regulator